MEDYFAAKARAVHPGARGRGVVCVDDAYGAGGWPTRRRSRSLTVAAGGDPDADWRADASVGADGDRFTFVGARPACEVDRQAPLPGALQRRQRASPRRRCSSRPASTPAAAAAGIGALPGVPGRMERGRAGQAVHSRSSTTPTRPDAVERAAGDAARRPRTGPADRGPRAAAATATPPSGRSWGRPPRALADVAVVTNDNPRSEDPAAIRAAVARGCRRRAGAASARTCVEVDRRAAIAAARCATARPGDIVVVAGKGHEQGQEVAGVVHPFDDRVVLRAPARLGWSSESRSRGRA